MTGPTKRLLAATAALIAVAMAAIAALGAYWEARADAELTAAGDEIRARGLPEDLSGIDAYLEEAYGPIPPGENGAAALTAAMAAIQEIDDMSPAPLDEGDGYEEPEEVERFLDAYGHLALPVQVALRDFRRFRFDSQWWTDDGPDTPVGLNFMQVTDLFELRAYERRVAGDLPAALQEVIALVSLGESLREVPRPLEQMCRLACLDAAATELRHLMERADAPLELAGAIPTIDVRPEFAAALATETAFYRTVTKDVFAEVERSGKGFGLVPTGAAMKLDLARVLRLQLEAIDLARRIDRDTVAALRAREDAFLEDAGPIAKLLVTSNSRILERVLHWEDTWALTQFGARVLAQWRQLGRWPNAGELPEAPVSAADGSPLRWAVVDGSFATTLGETSWTIRAR
jgi:hypothetical protein